MSVQQFIIGASVAVLVSNIPGGNCIGTLAPVGYARRATDVYSSYKTAKFNSVRNATLCSYNDRKTNPELLAKLEFLVTASMVQTQSVNCPKDPAYGNAFRTTYWGNPSLATYQSDYPKSHPLHDFGAAGPPDSTGLNSLRKLDQSSFRKERELVYMAARTVDLGRDDNYPVREEELAHAAIDMDLKVEGLCAAVFKAVKKPFSTYTELCTEYHNESEAAVDAAHKEDWTFWEDKNGITIVSRKQTSARL
ncbi:hypothetical protein FOZ61_008419 [Perkinsus olseni]|uniref:Uncharacterized protein n=1 Tax=Perkinsus olseni TaxID=32597 RepID=A0A7J6L4T2_PEROL|nr:hypothetical protein FOZ61_008419 [Perkinsus olseni]